jgi:hypothetical protein
MKTKLMTGSIVRIPVSFGYIHPTKRVARLTTDYVEVMFIKFTDETKEYAEIEYLKHSFIVSCGQINGEYE